MISEKDAKAMTNELIVCAGMSLILKGKFQIWYDASSYRWGACIGDPAYVPCYYGQWPLEALQQLRKGQCEKLALPDHGMGQQE